MARTGVIYLATDNLKYRVMCACSVLSLRWAGYTGPVRMLVDSLNFDLTVFLSLDVEVVQVDIPPEGRKPSRWIKTHLDLYSSFERTLFLDCDVIALQHPDAIWEALHGANFGLVQDPASVARCTHATEPELNYTHQICLSSPQYNTGVMAWQRADSTTQLFSMWHEEWLLFKDVDQLALARALHRLNAVEPTTSIMELPRIFNINAFDTAYDAIEAGVVFWHLWGRKKLIYDQVFGPVYDTYWQSLSVE